MIALYNYVAYIQKHNGIDNEKKIPNQIASFRWSEYFTDENTMKNIKF